MRGHELTEKDLPTYLQGVFLFSKNLKNFQKSQNFPKISKFYKNLKNLQKSQFLKKILKFSENLKIFQKSQFFSENICSTKVTNTLKQE